MTESLKSSLLDNVYVSTSYPEYEKEALKYGAEVIQRPESLSRDNSTAIEVLRHFAEVVDSDYYALVQPTFVPISVDIINGCIEAIGGYCDIVLSVSPPKERFLYWKSINGIGGEIKPLYNEWMIGQKFYEKVFVENGACYVFSKRFIRDGHDFGFVENICTKPFVCSSDYVDIDTYEDLLKARKLMKKVNNE